MMFKDIKQNYHVHILDKERVKYMKGKVISVSFPRMMMMQGGAQQVVDVTIECDGKTATYSIQSIFLLLMLETMFYQQL